jgi:hypothetical protein
MFKDPADEFKVYAILSAYTQEWGHENIVVSVPDSWREHCGPQALGRVRLEFGKRRSVGIRVDYGGTIIAYEAKLEPEAVSTKDRRRNPRSRRTH